MVAEWPLVSLADLIDIKHGFAFEGQSISDEPSGDILVTPGNFAIGGGFKDDKLKYFGGVVPNEFVLDEGDLIVTMTDLSKQADTLGYPAIVPARRGGRRFLHNQRIGRVAVRDEAALNAGYLYYVMRGRQYRNEVLASATGTSIKHTSPNRIRQYQFRCATIAEQRAIAHILGTLDAKIEVNRRMNETLEATARALFRSWFVDFDQVRAKAEGRDPALPPHLADLFPDRLVDSELGEIPQGWACGTLGAHAERIIEKVRDPADWAEEHLIDLSRMPQRSISLSAWGYGAELTTSVTRFQSRDTLFGAIRPYFHKVGVAPVAGVTNISVFVIRPKFTTDWPFVTLYCSLKDTVEYATRVAKGTKMPVVSWSDLANASVIVADDAVRLRFNQTVEPMLDQIIANIGESRALATLRDALIPKLISGDLRVKDAEKIAARALA